MTRSKKSTRGSLLAKGGIRRQPAKFKRVGPASPAAQAPADLDECLQRLRSLRVEDMADGAAQFIEKIGSLMYKILAAEARGVVDSAFVSRAVDAQGNVLNEGMKAVLEEASSTPETSHGPANAILALTMADKFCLRSGPSASMAGVSYSTPCSLSPQQDNPNMLALEQALKQAVHSAFRYGVIDVSTLLYGRENSLVPAESADRIYNQIVKPQLVSTAAAEMSYETASALWGRGKDGKADLNTKIRAIITESLNKFRKSSQTLLEQLEEDQLTVLFSSITLKGLKKAKEATSTTPPDPAELEAKSLRADFNHVYQVLAYVLRAAFPKNPSLKTSKMGYGTYQDVAKGLQKRSLPGTQEFNNLVTEAANLGITVGTLGLFADSVFHYCRSEEGTPNQSRTNEFAALLHNHWVFQVLHFLKKKSLPKLPDITMTTVDSRIAVFKALLDRNVERGIKKGVIDYDVGPKLLLCQVAEEFPLPPLPEEEGQEEEDDDVDDDDDDDDDEDDMDEDKDEGDCS